MTTRSGHHLGCRRSRVMGIYEARVLLALKRPIFNKPSRLASVPKRSPSYVVIGLDTDPAMCCYHTNPWPDNDLRTDRIDLCVANLRRDRQQTVPNGCCHLDRLGILDPFGCRPVWSSSQRDHHCTVLCCCFPPPAWAQTPMSHQLGHRYPVRSEREELLERDLLAGLRPWHRRVEPVRRPTRAHQYHVVCHVQAALNGTWFLFLPVGC